METLYSNRLILRPITIEDATALHSVFGDARVMQFSEGTKSKGWVSGWILSQHGECTSGGLCSRAIVEQVSNQVIGYCGLLRYGKPSKLEIAFRLARPYWNLGYGTEASSAYKDYAFQNFDVSELIAMIHPYNKAAIRVVNKLGMTYQQQLSSSLGSAVQHCYSLNNRSY